MTGASNGIGRAIAERLAREGATVVVNHVVVSDEARWLTGQNLHAGGGVVM